MPRTAAFTTLHFLCSLQNGPNKLEFYIILGSKGLPYVPLFPIELKKKKIIIIILKCSKVEYVNAICKQIEPFLAHLATFGCPL